MRTPRGMPLRCGAREAPLPAMAARRERCSLLLARRGTRLLLLSRVSSLTVPFPRLDPAQTSLVATSLAIRALLVSRGAPARATVSRASRSSSRTARARWRRPSRPAFARPTTWTSRGSPSASATARSTPLPSAGRPARRRHQTARAPRPRPPLAPRSGSKAPPTPPSAAALIAKGEAAVRLGDHRRANEAFAAARAMQELARSRSASPPGGSRAAGAGADPNPTPPAPPSSPFAPFVLALLPDGAAHLGVAVDAATATNVRARVPPPSSVRTPPAAPASFVNLGDASETAVARAAAICRDAGVGFVQAALAGDATDARNGTVRAWVASAEGPAVVSAAVTVALAPVCGGGEGNDLRDGEDVREADGEDVREAAAEDADDSAASSTRSSVTVFSGSRDRARGVRASRRFAHGVAFANRRRRWTPPSPNRANSRVCAKSRAARNQTRTPPRARRPRRNLASTTRSRRVDAISGERGALELFVVAHRRLADAEASARSSAEERDALPRARRITRDDVPRRGDARDDRRVRVRERRAESPPERTRCARPAGARARRRRRAASRRNARRRRRRSRRKSLISERVSNPRASHSPRLDARRVTSRTRFARATRRRRRTRRRLRANATTRDARRRDAERRAEVCLARAEAAEVCLRARRGEGTHARRGGGGSRVTKSRRREDARRDDARRDDARREDASSRVSPVGRRRSRGEGGTQSVVARVSPQSYRFAVGIRARRRRGTTRARGGGVRRARRYRRRGGDGARATRRAELADRALDESRSSSRRAVEAAVEVATRDADAKVREATARREEDARFDEKNRRVGTGRREKRRARGRRAGNHRGRRRRRRGGRPTSRGCTRQPRGSRRCGRLRRVRTSGERGGVARVAKDWNGVA